MSKFFKATTLNGVCNFEVTDDKRIVQSFDDGHKRDVTFLVLIGSGTYSDPEQALIDLYTDEDGTENVSIVEVTK